MRKSLVLLALTFPFFTYGAACSLPGLPATLTLTSELSSTVPSVSLGVYALVENKSNTTISDAALAVDVVEKATGVSVDRFVVPQHLTVLAGSSAKLGFVWKVPPALSSGAYTLLATLVPPDAARADVFAHVLAPSATRDIKIVNGAPAGAKVEALKINGAVYQDRTIASITDDRAQVLETVVNAGAGPYKGTLTWRVYAPNASLSDAPLAVDTMPVELHPGMSLDVPYRLTDVSIGYYLEGQLSDGQHVSYIDAWITRGDAFKDLACLNASQSGALTLGTWLIIGIILAVLAAGLAWRMFEVRRA